MNEDELIIYPCKITGGRHAELRLPPELSAADVRRIHAFLLTQVDDESDVSDIIDRGFRPDPEPAQERRVCTSQHHEGVTHTAAASHLPCYFSCVVNAPGVPSRGHFPVGQAHWDRRS